MVSSGSQSLANPTGRSNAYCGSWPHTQPCRKSRTRKRQHRSLHGGLITRLLFLFTGTWGRAASPFPSKSTSSTSKRSQSFSWSGTAWNNSRSRLRRLRNDRKAISATQWQSRLTSIPTQWSTISTIPTFDFFYYTVLHVAA